MGILAGAPDESLDEFLDSKEENPADYPAAATFHRRQTLVDPDDREPNVFPVADVDRIGFPGALVLWRVFPQVELRPRGKLVVVDEVRLGKLSAANDRLIVLGARPHEQHESNPILRPPRTIVARQN